VTKYSLVVLFHVMLLPCGLLDARTIQELFDRGNALYQAGKYQDAANDYESIIADGYVNDAVYFNLGNAYYRSEKLGRAVLAYERAAYLHPNDPDIEHNLKLVYLRTVDRIEPVPDLFIIQWLREVGSLLSTEAVRVLFAICWTVMFFVLALMYFIKRPEQMRLARLIFFTAMVLTPVWIAMMGIQLLQESALDKAIVTAQTVTVKSSPDAKSVDAFVIHEGVKVKLSDAVGGWVKIILADGKVGWILADQCEPIWRNSR
jgi:tetratricopeptide (TPR) repeat protein